MIGHEEALLLLKKWKDEATPIRFLAVLSGVNLSCDCSIDSTAPAGVVLQLSGNGNCGIVFEGWQFSWIESKDWGAMTEEARKLAGGGHNFVSALFGARGEADRIIFLEVSADPRD